MKVVYVFRSLAIWGGIERIIVDKANYLSGLEGYEVSILTADQGDHPVPYAVNTPVRLQDLKVGINKQYRYRGLHRLWKGWQLERCFVRKLRQRLAELCPDVVVCVATDYACLVSEAVGGRFPIVVESHSIYRRTFDQRRLLSGLYDWRLKRMLKSAHTIVALTEGDAADWRLHYGNVRCIANMVNQNPTCRRADAAHRRVIFVGRMDSQKRAEVALSIWARVADEYPDWQLHVYGDGDRRQIVDSLAERVRGVVVHDPTDRIFDAYCDSSFLILTSVFEPFGLVMPEAMSCGLPVVAFDCPYGPRSIITEGSDGFLVTEGDEQAFADCMKLLMSSHERCRTMGDAAILKARRYTSETIMPQWTALFNDVTRLLP